MSESERLLARGKQVMPGGSSNLGPMIHPGVYAARASGVHVTDVEGKVYVDFFNNWSSLVHGHGHPVINAATVNALELSIPITVPSEPEIALAEHLCARAPSFERIKFNSSGTAAGAMAAKAARAFTGRRMLAKVEGIYHGNYDALEISSLVGGPQTWGDEARPNRTPLNAHTPRQLVDDTVILPFNDVAAAERLLREHATELAAVFIDLNPMPCGLPIASQAYVDMLASVSKDIGALLVVDEVISFRLAVGGAQQRYGLRPDLTMLGKIIGGGSLAIGALAGRADVMAMFGPKVPTAGTFTSNPITMAAGLACMQLLTDDAIATINRRGDRMKSSLQRAFESSGYPGQVTSVGSMFAFHLHQRPVTGYRSMRSSTPEEDADLALLRRYMTEHGYLIGVRGGFLSTVTTDADCDAMAERFEHGLRHVLASR